MKHFIILSVWILFPILTLGQAMPETFFDKAPKIPDNACIKDIEKIHAFENRVDSLLESIENEKERRNEENDADTEKYEQQALNKITKQFGLSESDLKKLQEEDLSDEEADKLVDKALRNSNNISLGEIKNLDKMNSEGQKAWTDAYSTEKMAEIQYDGQKNWEQQLQNKKQFELITMQKLLLDSITAIESKFKQQLAEIDQDAEAKVMLENINKWELRATELMGYAGNAEVDALNRKIDAEKEIYCNKYSLKYFDILRKYKSYTNSCLTTCYKIESISAQLTKIQTGVDMKQKLGLVGIGKVTDYIHLLRGAYKYNLFKNR